ncbi:MAG TPA: hypothetical protein PLX96_06310 [Candidatus Omnitrophota bacterium]|nr:hypothetical protein [Candidatus Omnitrophota bacterium]
MDITRKAQDLTWHRYRYCFPVAYEEILVASSGDDSAAFFEFAGT